MAADKLWILLLGLALLAVAVWSWHGGTRWSRWWTRIWEGDFMALGAAPGAGLILTGLGVIAVWGDGVTLLGALLWLAGFPVFAIGAVWRPRWWGPSWWRAMGPRARAEALRGPARDVARRVAGEKD